MNEVLSDSILLIKYAYFLLHRYFFCLYSQNELNFQLENFNFQFTH